ncbi:MAG: glycosyltransferase family 2 protein [Planctomycetota bacterium]
MATPLAPCSVLVAVPVYNEQKHVANVIERVTRHADCVLVVDDGSTDYTPMLLAMQAVDVIRHKQNLGYGRSIRDAFRWAESYGYKWLITMDCDDQHEPEALPRFFEAIAADDADIVSGTRYPEGFDAQPSDPGLAAPIDRRQINARVTQMVNDRLGLGITDAFCGFRAYRVAGVDHDTLSVDGYAIPLQQWVQAAAQGLRVREVPVPLIYNDPKRSFGGALDDAEHRMRHYTEVFEREIAKVADRLPSGAVDGAHRVASSNGHSSSEVAGSSAKPAGCSPCGSG